MVYFLHRYVGASEMHHYLHADHILHLVGDDFGTVVLPYFGPGIGDSKINSNGWEKGIRNVFFQGVEFWMSHVKVACT